MKNRFIFLNILIISLLSCKQEVKNETEIADNFIKISKEQFQSENMELGTLEYRNIEAKVSFTGKIIPQVNSSAKITVPVSGKITSIKVQKGATVKQNQVILTIGGNEFIDLQQSFASSSAKLKQLKANFDKAETLYKEQIKSENDYLLIESDYKAELAKNGALKTKLQQMGLNISQIKNGNFATHYAIKAPISGQISDFNVSRGQHINTETTLLELSDSDKTELQLSLFEKNYASIKKGQKVQFRSLDKNTSSEGFIDRIGGKLNSNSNTIDAFASISASENHFAINQMVSGEIIIATDTVQAIPKSAVFTIGKKHFILVKNSTDETGFVFEKRQVQTGKSSDNYVEITDALKDSEILIKGTYNLNIE